MSIDQIRTAALALPTNQRLELADSLYSSLEAAGELQLTPEWIAELHRRSDDLESGREATIPWEEIRKEMEETH